MQFLAWWAFLARVALTADQEQPLVNTANCFLVQVEPPASQEIYLEELDDLANLLGSIEVPPLLEVMCQEVPTQGITRTSKVEFFIDGIPASNFISAATEKSVLFNQQITLVQKTVVYTKVERDTVSGGVIGGGDLVA